MFKPVLASAVLALVIAQPAAAAGPLHVTTNFYVPLLGGQYQADLQSIGVGFDLDIPATVEVYGPTKVNIRLLASNPNPASGFQVTSLTVGGATYAVGPQAFSAAGTLLGTQVFTGSFTGAVGFTASDFDPEQPPVFWPDGFDVHILSADADEFTGIGPFIGSVDKIYFTVANSALFEVSSAVPEPATWAMMIIGFGAVGSMVRTSRRRYDFQRRSAIV